MSLSLPLNRLPSECFPLGVPVNRLPPGPTPQELARTRYLEECEQFEMHPGMTPGDIDELAEFRKVLDSRIDELFADSLPGARAVIEPVVKRHPGAPTDAEVRDFYKRAALGRVSSAERASFEHALTLRKSTTGIEWSSWHL